MPPAITNSAQIKVCKALTTVATPSICWRVKANQKPRTSADYLSERLIAVYQQMQRENPFGSKLHRYAYNKIREIVQAWKGEDIGEYE